MKKKLLTLIFVAGASAFGQISIGITIGSPPPPRVVRVRPRAPSQDYFWVDGYWYPSGKRYKWHDGYWTRTPYAGAVWYAPRYDGGRFYEGYWGGPRGQFNHDHKWDRRRERDFDRDDKNRGRGRGHDKH